MKIRKLMALVLAVLLAAAMTACGTRQEASVQEETAQMEKELTPRQVAILEEMGLPAEYDRLNAGQQSAIHAIETLLVRLEEKYGEEFCYLGYVAGGGVDREHLIARPAGGSERDAVTIYRWAENGTVQYEDNYSAVKARPFFEEAVAAFVGEYVSPDACKIYCRVYSAEADVTAANAAEKVSASVYLFVNEKKASLEQCEALGEACGQWLLDNCNGMSSGVLLMRTGNEEMLLITEDTYYSSLWKDIFSLRKEYIVEASGQLRILE